VAWLRDRRSIILAASILSMAAFPAVFSVRRSTAVFPTVERSDSTVSRTGSPYLPAVRLLNSFIKTGE
jgi:hypothetical protein